MRFAAHLVEADLRDPALWTAVAICSVLAWFVGKGIGQLSLQLRDRRLQSAVIAGGCVILGPALGILAHVVFEGRFRATHDVPHSSIVSEGFSFPLLVVPSVLLWASARRSVAHQPSHRAA
jgi:hypothetical protein